MRLSSALRVRPSCWEFYDLNQQAAKGDARDCRGKGRFYFFWNLPAADALGSWDLVVSAPWLEERRLKPLGEFIELLTKSIGRQSLRQFARIVALNPRDPSLKAVVSAYAVDDGEVRVQHSKLFGLDIEDAIIMRAKKAA